jgi:benzoyl-CoA reductase/2-hydroxyglutaryl-CoA dehydratase subunit BcrC/BadD/HgdB
MNASIAPLLTDGFENEPPAKRVLQYVKSRKAQNHPVAGIYCGYAPIELLHAMNVVPAVLCAFSQAPIATAETVLPANLCPLIKSSFGFIQEGTCPFYALSDVVVAETTCDGKKKMFELIADVKPTHVMDLPQLADEPEALANWKIMIRKLQGFLEGQFDRQATDERIEAAIVWNNRKNRLMRKVFEYAARTPPAICWQEVYELAFLAIPATGQEMVPILEAVLEKLEQRVAAGIVFGRPDAPRVMVSGCPVGGDATKIFRIIEEAGAVVVALDACSGMKAFMGEIEENTNDPVTAIARRYLEIPCACMTPNQRRLDGISEMIETFRPQVVVDFILQACHAYNVESHKVGEHVAAAHGLPFLKVESDYADSDVGRIRTRVEAMLEMVNAGA